MEKDNNFDAVLNFVKSTSSSGEVSTINETRLTRKVLGSDLERTQKNTDYDFLSVEEYNKRDFEYTAILQSFRTQYKEINAKNLNLREKFFWIVIISYVFVLLASFVVIGVSISSKNSDSVIITSIISALVSILSSVIVLPQIIAKYLFHEDEQKYTIDMMSKFHQNDQMIRDNHIKEMEKKRNNYTNEEI